jgi:hypothetical protein
MSAISRTHGANIWTQNHCIFTEHLRIVFSLRYQVHGHGLGSRRQWGPRGTDAWSRDFFHGQYEIPIILFDEGISDPLPARYTTQTHTDLGYRSFSKSPCHAQKFSANHALIVPDPHGPVYPSQYIPPPTPFVRQWFEAQSRRRPTGPSSNCCFFAQLARSDSPRLDF